jgi:hypothetical protein
LAREYLERRESFRTAFQVDVREAVGNDLLVVKPDLLFQQRPFSLSLRRWISIRGQTRLLFIAHKTIPAQIGQNVSHLTST